MNPTTHAAYIHSLLEPDAVTPTGRKVRRERNVLAPVCKPEARVSEAEHDRQQDEYLKSKGIQ